MRHGSPRRRPAVALLAVAATLIALLAAPAPGNAALRITSTELITSDTGASKYPYVSLQMTFCPTHPYCNTGDKNSPLNDFSVTLPAGLVPTTGDRPRCSQEAFLQALSAADCPPGSDIGVIEVRVLNWAGLPTVAEGTLLSIEPRGTEPAMIGVFIDPLVNSNYELTRLLAPVTVKDGDTATFSVPNIPDAVHYDDGSVFWPYFKVTQITLQMWGSETITDPYLRNPTSCASGNFQIDVKSSDGTSAKRAIPYETTDCELLPFTPSLSLNAGEPGQTAGNSSPPVGLNVSVPEDQAAVASAKVKLPPALRPSSAALAAHSCHPDDYEAGDCPADAQVGSLAVVTPLLTEPLSGPIYLVKAPGEMRTTVIAKLEGLVPIELVGSAGFEGNQSVVTFSDLPDVPVDDFAVALDGGPDGVFTASGGLCNAALAAQSEFTGKNGSLRTVETPVTVSGCGPATASVDGGRLPVTAGYAPVVVRCSAQGASCSGSVALAAAQATKTRRGKRRRAKRMLAAGSASFQVPAGRSKVVAIKLSRATAKSLATKRKLKATASLGPRSSAVVLVAERRKRSPKRR